MENSKLKKIKINNPKKNRFSKITEDLYWARIPLPFRLDHVNIYAINSNDGLVIIDTGIDNRLTRKCWGEIIENLSPSLSLSKIIITHHHPDHIGASKFLSKKLNLKVFAPKIELRRIKKIMSYTDIEYGKLLSQNYKEFGLDKKLIERVKHQGNSFKKMVKHLPEINSIENPLTIETKKGIWKGRFDTGHSPSQLSLYDEERKIYLCFDFLLPRISPNISVGIDDNENNVLDGYLKYLNKIKQKMDKNWSVFPGHEYPYTDPSKRAVSLIKHHRNRLDTLLKAISKKPINVSEATEILFGKTKNDHDIFFASCEAKSHLNYLINKEKIIKKKQKNKDIKYYYVIRN